LLIVLGVLTYYYPIKLDLIDCHRDVLVSLKAYTLGQLFVFELGYLDN
jgi:hypothetical protein